MHIFYLTSCEKTLYVQYDMATMNATKQHVCFTCKIILTPYISIGMGVWPHVILNMM